MSHTLLEIKEMVISQAEGGVFTDETKFPQALIFMLIHQARATTIREMRLIAYPDVLYQQILPTYSGRVQTNDSCYVEFAHPPVMAFSLGDGFRYVGNVNQMDNFVRFGGGAMKSVYSKHPITRLGPQNGTMWDWKVDETGYGKIQIYNNEDIEEILTQTILADPTQAPSYRVDTDIYPISMEMLHPMLEVMNRLLLQQSTMPADLLSSSSDIYAQGQQPPNRRR